MNSKDVKKLLKSNLVNSVEANAYADNIKIKKKENNNPENCNIIMLRLEIPQEYQQKFQNHLTNILHHI